MGNAYKQGYRAHLKRSRWRDKSRSSACRTDSRTFSVGWGVLCNSSNNHMHEWTVETLDSFPGHSHLQYLIAYSMQIQREKAWEIWLLAVTSGGQCPTRNLKALSCTLCPKGGGQSVSKAESIPSVVHSARDDLTWNGNYYCRAPPPVHLPSVYLT